MSPLSGGAPSLSDGKDRVTTVVVATATERGIRALRGGGAVFAQHGLISPSVARHVSMIVDPAGVRFLTQGLLEQGWRLVPLAARGLLPAAIVTVESPSAGIRVNLHGVIPGFVIDPADVFDDLWDAREELAIDGPPIPILDRYATMMFAMHHRLEGQRMPRSKPGNAEFFTRQFSALLSSSERTALLSIVRRLGAQSELRDLLDALALTKRGGTPTVSRAYVTGRLALADPADADIALLSRLEDGGWDGVPDVRGPALAGAMVRMLGARRRVADRDRPAAR